MSGRDWYAEWLLGEVSALLDEWEVKRMPNGQVVMRYRAPYVRWHWRWGRDFTEALELVYRNLTGSEPPSRPTEDEVRAFRYVLEAIEEGARDDETTALSKLAASATSDDPRERMMARAVVEGVGS